MKRHTHLIRVAALLIMFCQARAQDEQSLTRDEVAVIKKKLVSVLEALGQPPAGYEVERESFSLPTETYRVKESGRYNLLGASATREYGSGKSAERANKDFGKEYEKKMAEAQAKGDFEAMAMLAQEMQKKAGAMQLKAVEGKKEPITVNVHFNSNPGAAIDPDAVVLEKPGVIALRANTDVSSERGNVQVYFDPVSLKDTKQLSRVNMKEPEGGVSKRTTILNATIDFSGPTAELGPWAKRIDAKKVLAQIDAAK